MAIQMITANFHFGGSEFMSLDLGNKNANEFYKIKMRTKKFPDRISFFI